MNTPAALIWAISLVPKALIAVVNTMRIVARMTPLSAWAAVSSSPCIGMNWNPSHSSGSVACSASATAAMETIDAVSIVQPASHAVCGLVRRLVQL
jgi:hypothetical protein